MNDIVNILAAPGHVFGKMTIRPKYLTALLLNALTVFVLLWLGGCWHNIADALSASSILGPALLSPLIVAIVSIGTTTLLYLLSIILGGQMSAVPSFKTMYSLNVHCAAIILLGEIINFLLVHANILGESNYPLANRFPVGLDLILLAVNEPSIYATIVLHCTSLFVLWYFVVLAKGISAVTGASKTRSGLIAAALWGAIVISVLGLVYAAGGTTTITMRL